MLLDDIVAAQKLGQAAGIPAICSAHPWVLEKALHHARQTGAPVLVEATCNQVNQFGGYTGMQPPDFVLFVRALAERAAFPLEKLLLGGDHLGPTPWQAAPARVAMDLSQTLVRDYVLAGFTKLHLDASMHLGDDAPGPLPVALAANRAADLAQVAEAAFAARGGGEPPRYVIGTEVPIAGGIQDPSERPAVTRVPDLVETLETSRAAFLARGLHAAWDRVVAVVVQPGVEYSSAGVWDYDRVAARALIAFIEAQPHIVYEAHSTDYQARDALRRMVEDHFAILKVGPALTFALREALFALALIEHETMPPETGSGLIDVLETAMTANPVHWQNHYRGDAPAQAMARKYSFSDRSRYYWPALEVQAAVAKLLHNLAENPAPLTLLSQFLPVQYAKIRAGQLLNDARALVADKVGQVLEDYAVYGREGAEMHGEKSGRLCASP